MPASEKTALEAVKEADEERIKLEKLAEELGMISHKMSLTTIFGHKHEIKNFHQKN